MNAQQLASILDEELERDGWGEIDPYLIKTVAEGIDDEDDNASDVHAIEQVLERAALRVAVHDARVYDALRFVAQEARSLIMSGRSDARYDERLRKSLDLLADAYNKL